MSTFNAYTTNDASLARWVRNVGDKFNEMDERVRKVQTITAVTKVATENNAIPLDVTAVAATESGYVIDGVTYSEVTASYTSPSPRGNFNGVYLVAKNYRGSAELVKIAEHNYTGSEGGSASFNVTLQRTNETINLFFVAKNVLGGAREDWQNAPTTTVLLDGNASAPSAPTGLSASYANVGVSLGWNQNVELNLAGYKVYRNTVNTFGSSTMIANLGVGRNGNPSYVDSTTNLGSVYYYWITAVNEASQESTESTSVLAVPGGGGTTAVSVSGTFGSATTTTTITLYWDGTNGGTTFTLRFADGSSKVIPSGNLPITGLTLGTTYKIYPYFDVANNTVSAATGGVGSPAVCFTAASSTASAQCLQAGRIPLATSSITTATTAAGTGGGGAGGGDGCIAPWMLVETDKGEMPIQFLAEGDVISCPEGWTTVTRVREPEQDTLITLTLEDDTLFECSPSHPVALENDRWSRADSLEEGNLVITLTGMKRVKSLKSQILSYVSVLPSCSPYHGFYCNGVLTHNVVMVK